MKNRLILFLPIILIVTTAIIFRVFSILLGKSWSIIIGFSFYQIIWCTIIPLVFLGKNSFLELFKQKERFFQKKNIVLIVLFLLPIIGALFFFIPNLSKYSLLTFLIGIPVTTINSTCEEIFWRGLFVKEFYHNKLLAIFFPTFFFALWHVSPEMANISVSFNDLWILPLITLPLGFVYSILAYKTKTIKWVAISHSISGILAFGVPISTSILEVVRIN